MAHLNKLIELLVKPEALPLMLLGLVVIWLAIRVSAARWVLFGSAMFAASLAKFAGFYADEPWPNYAGLIEPLVQFGRPITVLLLGLILSLAFFAKGNRVAATIPPMMRPIHAIQCVLIAKSISGGAELGFTIQAAIVFVLIGIMAATTIRQWMYNERFLDGPALALCTTGLFFCLIGEYQWRVDPAPATLGGRFMGTTSNPQHAAALLAICLLGPVYYIVTRNWRNPRITIPCILLAVMILHLLFLTGSRTGLAMAAIVLAVFLRRQFSVTTLVGIGLILVVLIALRGDSRPEALDEMLGRGDTRSAIWAGQWEEFKRFPLFGKPTVGKQMRPSENSWLGLMAAAGIVGGIALLWLLIEQIRSALALLRAKVGGRDIVEVDFCLAGWAAVFAGSFFEAYLLGVVTMPVLCIVLLASCTERVQQRIRGIGTAEPNQQGILVGIMPPEIPPPPPRRRALQR